MPLNAVVHIIGINPNDPQGLKDYLDDPSGVVIELNYPANEAAAA